jgi:hypothetical protein
MSVQRLPPDANPTTIESLDLSNAGMNTVDVSPYVCVHVVDESTHAACMCINTCVVCVCRYVNLRVLLLRGNALTTLVGLGLDALKQLKVTCIVGSWRV